MNNREVWAANSEKLVKELDRLVKLRGRYSFEMNPKKVMSLTQLEFLPILHTLERELGIENPIDYKRYLSGSKVKKLNTVNNQVKLKYLLETFNNKNSCNIESIEVKKISDIKIENVFKPKILHNLNQPENGITLPEEEIKKFYNSSPWKQKRYEALKLYGNKCYCCGAKPSADNNVKIHVDHIKPLRYNWSLRLDIDNLQILCETCNVGKGSKYDDTWR